MSAFLGAARTPFLVAPIKCCYSCRYWKLASRKVPVDVVKVPKEEEYIEFRVGAKVARVPAWEWKPAPGVDLRGVKVARLCLYGKGVVKPWDECGNYAPESGEERALCEGGVPCEFSADCPKFRVVASYIA